MQGPALTLVRAGLLVYYPHMTPRLSLMTAIGSALLLAGCGADEVQPQASTPAPVATTPAQTSFQPSIPRLAEGPHLGMITGFDPLDAAREADARARYAAARSAGATIGRIQIDWSELETGPGVYDQEALDNAFADFALDGMNVIVLVSTLDSDGLTVPSYLGEADGLSEGRTFASREVIEAFNGLLDWLRPQLESRSVWGLSIGNEVDSPINDGIVTPDDATTFYEATLSHWNDTSPDIGVAVTLTIGAIDSLPAFQASIRDASDFVIFNYYCLDAALTVTGPAQWEADLAAMKQAAGERDIFIQELGCPVGYSPQALPTSIGGSLENQVAFFDYFADVFADDPQMRAATMFQLFDWSPELARSFSDPVRDAGEELAADRLEEWLATSGFVRWTDLAERPAWNSWLSALEKARAAREQ